MCFDTLKYFWNIAQKFRDTLYNQSRLIRNIVALFYYCNYFKKPTFTLPYGLYGRRACLKN